MPSSSSSSSPNPSTMLKPEIIEEEQLQLRKYIEENYSKIRDVEIKLANLTLKQVEDTDVDGENSCCEVEGGRSSEVQDYGYFLGVEDDNKWAKKRHLIQKVVPEWLRMLLDHHANGGNVQVMNEQNQQPNVEVEGRGKKKVHFQGRGRRIGAVPKGRGFSQPGWTVAGFDVDGRS
ncbi:hypothetical protein Peur_072879 [Populus x canadensis]